VNESVPVSICVQTAAAAGLRSYEKKIKEKCKKRLTELTVTDIITV